MSSPTLEDDRQTAYDNWIVSNLTELQESWAMIGRLDQWREGPEFEDYCKNQYEESQ